MMMVTATASNNGSGFLSSSLRLRLCNATLPAKLPLHKANNIVVSCSNAKRANLSASRIQRIKLPVYEDPSNGDRTQSYHISHFLSHSSGIQAILNTRALQNFQFLDANEYRKIYGNSGSAPKEMFGDLWPDYFVCNYTLPVKELILNELISSLIHIRYKPLTQKFLRCTLPKLVLLNFEAAPVLDLRVIPTKDDCTVELFSCKFKGSKVVEQQNEHFSATMINHITWDTNNSEPFLEVNVKLNLSLEIYTRPFTLLPVSAVERPGNLMIQALVDRLVPLLLQQLLQDYENWVHQQTSKFLIN